MNVYYDEMGRLSEASGTSDGGSKPDLCLAVAGERPYAEGEGDSASISIHEDDIQMLANMGSACKKLVVILVSGRPIIISDWIDHWDAVVAAWLPGTEGGGVADVLFGSEPFTGKLPYTWPLSVDQLPYDFENPEEVSSEALFPFGFGLE